LGMTIDFSTNIGFVKRDKSRIANIDIKSTICQNMTQTAK